MDGPESAGATLLLAHGAGAGMESPFLRDVAAGLAAAGIRVVRFEFPYMAARRQGSRRGPDPQGRLLDCFRAAVERWRDAGPLSLGGKSMGGRMATMVADELGARSVVVFGYPFHPPGRPDRLRVAHLGTLATPTLILQGERDPFGGRAEVPGYPLGPAIQLEWLPDGDHSLAPRRRSGRSAEENLTTALAAAAGFVLRHHA